MRRYTLLYIVMALALVACKQQAPLRVSEAPEKVIRQWLDSAEIYISEHDYTEAMRFLNGAESAANNIENDSVAYRLYNNLAYLHERSGSPKLALTYQQQALKYAKRTKKGRFIVDILNREIYTLYKMGLTDSAWTATREAMKHYPRANDSLKAQILQHVAYHKMLVDSLDEAMTILAKSVSHSSAPMPDSATIKALYSRLPMENMMLEDLLTLQNKYDTAMLEAEKVRQQMYFSWFIAFAIVAVVLLLYIVRRREQQLIADYEQRLYNVRNDMEQALSTREATIEEMKAAVDRSLQETEALRSQLPKSYISSKNNDFIEQTKLGIDTIYAIAHGDNISQMGRKEQIAAIEVMKIIDGGFAQLLTTPSPPLTPKETFFCIMEHYGKSDYEKASSFCCSEQAIRSTKSRLNKKIDMTLQKAFRTSLS